MGNDLPHYSTLRGLILLIDLLNSIQYIFVGSAFLSRK